MGQESARPRVPAPRSATAKRREALRRSMERNSQEGSLQLVSSRTSISKSWLLEMLDETLKLESLGQLRHKMQSPTPSDRNSPQHRDPSWRSGLAENESV